MKYWLFGLIVMICGSCKKDSVDFPINKYEPNALLKRTLLYSSIESKDPVSILDEFEYDNQKRLSKVSSPWYENGIIRGTAKYDLYEYNAAGQLSKISYFNANLYSGFLNLKTSLYTYSASELKVKEEIRYPQIGSSEQILYQYNGAKLIKDERFNSKGVLESYTEYKYNGSNLESETAYSSNGEIMTVTNHFYTNGLNTLTEIYRGNNGTEKLREIKKTYDANRNLIIQESNELALWSSSLSSVMRYEY